MDNADKSGAIVEAFRPLVEEMRHQGVTAESHEARRLAELVQQLVDVEDEYEPLLEHTPEQLAGTAPWINTDQLNALVISDHLRQGIFETVEQEFGHYWAVVRRRRRRRIAYAKIAGFFIAVTAFAVVLAIWEFLLWLTNHPGSRLIGRDLERALGDFTAPLGVALFMVAYGVPMYGTAYLAYRVYRGTYRAITGEAPPTADAT
jgi:hypothetical protein